MRRGAEPRKEISSQSMLEVTVQVGICTRCKYRKKT